MPDVTRFSPTGQAYTDGLLSGTRWATSSLTISFPELGSLYGSGYGSGENINGFKSFSPAQRSAAAKVLDAFPAVTNLSFTQVKETSAQHADIRLAGSNDGATGWAYMPSPSRKAATSGST
jgi:serralysin